MSEHEAVVARVDGKFAWLQMQAQGCGQCAGSGGCGLGDGREARLQKVTNTVGARQGEIVVVSVPPGAVIKAAVISYLVPLMLAVCGAAVGTSWAEDIGAVAGAVTGLGAGWLWLRAVSSRLAQRAEPLLAMRLRSEPINWHRNPQT